jgi:hypothetical protein
MAMKQSYIRMMTLGVAICCYAFFAFCVDSKGSNDTIRKNPQSNSGITLFTQPNFGGTPFVFAPKPGEMHYLPVELTQFSATGIRSLEIPLGYCADINFNTNIPVPPHIGGPPHGGNAGGQHSFNERRPLIEQAVYRENADEAAFVDRNLKFDPGVYNTVDPTYVRPIMVTVYPWTDFYFSTDDPAVPSAIKEVFVGWTWNDQDYSGSTTKVSFNDQKVYTKHFRYKIPDGRKVGNIWEATRNGGDSGWDWHLSPNGDSIYVNCHVKVRAIAGPRNWEGVRCSLVDK